MKKIISFMIMIILTFLCAVPTYAVEKTVKAVPGNMDISAYAKYVDNTDFTTIPTDENGNGRVTLPDGTEIIISGANTSKGRIIVEEVTDKNVLNWIAEKLGNKASDAKVYYVYFLNENGTTQPTNGVMITIKTKSKSAYSVYAVSENQTAMLQSTAENGSVTFTTDGSSFYALCNDSNVAQDAQSPHTGYNVNMVLWIAMLSTCASMVVATMAYDRKRKREEN